jgi:hypothetical protein
MKYFTPQLYQQFNSFNVDEAEHADEEWDKREVAYKERLNDIKTRMPLQIIKLSQLCLHDAEVLVRTEQFEVIDGTSHIIEPFGFPFPLWTAVATIFVQLGDELVSLIYCLADRVKTTPAPEGWRFSNEQEQWLYDEVDVEMNKRELFVHRILFSTGIVLEIRFVSVVIQKFKLPALTSKIARHSA